jgi:2,3-bisphosphoglycerate-dependent phosphoglycerate mutase
VSSVRVCIIRHGQTAWNVDRRFQGWSDVPLNETGRRQAEELKQALDSREFDAVWSSDLRRAIETAEIVAGGAQSDRRLREMNFGDLEGSTWGEMDGALRASIEGFDAFEAPGGESTSGVRTRVTEFLDGLDPGLHLVVTHGGVIRMIKRECGADGFPDHGDVLDIDWTARTIIAGP